MNNTTLPDGNVKTLRSTKYRGPSGKMIVLAAGDVHDRESIPPDEVAELFAAGAIAFTSAEPKKIPPAPKPGKEGK